MVFVSPNEEDEDVFLYVRSSMVSDTSGCNNK